ncbi:g7947 [Coccomyxa viridis]|uniref:catalase n=1 Tax=Coccomyxa viridis TaxID=1274662 RepID=A0ABP1FZ60_9CHLO
MCNRAVLLGDYEIQERLFSLNRERIPERVVHARGTAAKGYFEVTDDITNLTYASIFSSIGKQTTVIVRFSIVSVSTGGPEWIRDPRGFAVMFYAGLPQGGPTLHLGSCGQQLPGI